MMLVNLPHGLFLTCTQKSPYIYRSFIARYTTFPPNLTPCISMGNPALLTWRTSFFARGDEYPSTLVSGLPTTAPPLALPLSPFHTPQFKLHYLQRRHQQSRSSLSLTLNMYIDVPNKNALGLYGYTNKVSILYIEERNVVAINSNIKCNINFTVFVHYCIKRGSIKSFFFLQTTSLGLNRHPGKDVGFFLTFAE
jgi:hypothetical protein